MFPGQKLDLDCFTVLKVTFFVLLVPTLPKLSLRGSELRPNQYSEIVDESYPLHIYYFI